jgi:hypothetical protein
MQLLLYSCCVGLPTTIESHLHLSYYDKNCHSGINGTFRSDKHSLESLIVSEVALPH